MTDDEAGRARRARMIARWAKARHKARTEVTPMVRNVSHVVAVSRLSEEDFRVTYEVPPLPAGPYAFICTVHPSMTGTLNVE